VSVQGVASKDELPGGEWLVGGGELGDRIRELDWSRTPLGARHSWSPCLRTTVNLILASGFPMILLWGRELTVLYNDACREIAAEAHPDALGRRPEEIWPEVARGNAPVFRHVLEGGHTVFREDRRFPIPRRGRAEDAFFTVSYSPVRDERGATGGVLVTLLETTQRVQERNAIESERARATDVLEHGAPCVVLDASGRLVLANRAWEELAGLPREAALGRSVWELYPAAQTSGCPTRLAVERVLRERVAEEVEAELGQERWLDLRLYPTAEGGVAVFLRDATVRKLGEQALCAGAERLSLAQRAGRLGVFDWDLVDDRFWLTPELEELFEIPPGSREERMAAWRARVHPEDLLRFDALRAAWLAGEGAEETSLEYRYATGDGERWIAMRARTFRDDRERAVRLVGTHMDITDRKRVEQALREADQRKDDFLAMLSHELRNPLASIRSGLTILGKARPGGEQAGRALAIMDRQTEQLTRLIDDLLDVTRIGRGKIRLHRDSLELGALVRSAVEDYRPHFARSGVELIVDVPEQPALPVHGDRARLAQVVGNLLTNAAKFTPRGGRATVTLRPDDGRHAVLRVRDTGMGISRESQARLFQPFMQVEKTLDRSRGGLGLGLALVKGITELHGGEVSVSSAGIGEGTEFAVRLPVRRAPARGVVTSKPPPSPGSRRVLIIEDNLDVAQSLQEVLQLGAHTVEVAADGPAGLACARAFHPEVVLCDLGLPGMDGFEVARALRADPELRAVHAVALSGYALLDDVRRSLAAGFDEHLAKPVDLATLGRVLAEAPRGRP